MVRKCGDTSSKTVILSFSAVKLRQPDLLLLNNFELNSGIQSAIKYNSSSACIELYAVNICSDVQMNHFLL